MSYRLRYIPGTPYGDRYPTWRWGERATREACEAVRDQCPSAAWIEVVPVGEGAANMGVSGGSRGKIGAQVKTAPNTELVPPAGACDQHPYVRGSASRG